MNFQLDGGNNTAGLRGTGNPAPNPEAMQEFRVITSNFSAEYGRYPAGIVDVVTKSGTNQWRGAAFEFFRNEVAERQALGAAGHDGDQGSARPQSVRRRVWRSDPAGQDVFLHQLFGPAANGDVLPEYRRHADRARARGDFSQSAQRPNDPATGQPFPGGIIPSTRFDAAARTIQDRYVPQSNLPNRFYEVSAADPLQTDEVDVQARSSTLAATARWRSATSI